MSQQKIIVEVIVENAIRFYTNLIEEDKQLWETTISCNHICECEECKIDFNISKTYYETKLKKYKTIVQLHKATILKNYEIIQSFYQRYNELVSTQMDLLFESNDLLTANEEHYIQECDNLKKEKTHIDKFVKFIKPQEVPYQ